MLEKIIMKKILFIAATSWELKIIKQEVKKHKPHDVVCSFLLLGMWNYNTILSLTKELEKNTYDFVVNIGVCGWTISDSHSLIQEITECIQVARIKNRANERELLVPVFLKITQLESIISSETIVSSSEEISLFIENDEGNIWVDMESYWVELVCEKYDIPRMLLKVPVDEIWEETQNFDFEKAKTLLAKNINYRELLWKIWEYLDECCNVGNENFHSLQALQKYSNFYKMSVTEKIMFQKLYNKYIVLIEDEWWEKFDNFFEKNKLLSKKNFFNLLDNID